MQTLKLLLLIVALTLPFRGAMAAVGVYCHLGSSNAFASAVQPHHHGDEREGQPSGAPAKEGHSHSGDSHSHAGESHHADAQVDVKTEGSAPLADTCTYCSASCGAAPLVPTTVPFAAPPPGAERFPALPVPHVRSVADGLERPPKAI